MKNEIYNQIYKCRMCGAEFCPVTTSGKDKASAMLENYIDRVNGRSNQMLYLAPYECYPHRCENGDLGVADFIGYKKQEL